MIFESAPAYRAHLLRETAIPQGFRFHATSLEFVPPERPDAGRATMNLAFIGSDTPATAVGVTTRNRFCGAPVTIARERLPQGRLQGLVVNNKVANVASATGVDDARRVAAATAARFGYPEAAVLPVSTGVIGWSLPVPAILAAVEELPGTECHPLDVAEAIMTTDRYPKLAWERREGVTCLGIAKGAGMIEPNLATMLGFIVCDADVDRDTLERVFRRVVDRTFNTISVDSDQSTSDMVVALANGASGRTIDEEALEALLEPVCRTLSREIVRNGEGTTHVLDVTVRGMPEPALARNIGRHVVNSPLVKTAVFGNDPNVGRILGAAGDALATWDPEGTVDGGRLEIAIHGETVYRDGAFRLDGAVEARLAERLRSAAMDPAVHGYPQDTGSVGIVLDFRAGDAVAAVCGSDLSYEYIRENADYRT